MRPSKSRDFLCLTTSNIVTRLKTVSRATLFVTLSPYRLWTEKKRGSTFDIIALALL